MHRLRAASARLRSENQRKHSFSAPSILDAPWAREASQWRASARPACHGSTPSTVAAPPALLPAGSVLSGLQQLSSSTARSPTPPPCPNILRISLAIHQSKVYVRYSVARLWPRGNALRPSSGSLCHAPLPNYTAPSLRRLPVHPIGDLPPRGPPPYPSYAAPPPRRSEAEPAPAVHSLHPSPPTSDFQRRHS